MNLKRTAAATLATVALTGAVAVPGAPARVPDQGGVFYNSRLNDEMPARGWPNMQATTAQALADARKKQDLRSPDARDATEGRGTFNAPDVIMVPEPSTPVSAPSGGGIDWADAGLGAGGTLAMMLLAAGGAVAVVRRRDGRAAPTV